METMPLEKSYAVGGLPEDCPRAARKGGTSMGRIPAKVGSLWSLRVWGLQLEISGQAEFFPGPCFF